MSKSVTYQIYSQDPNNYGSVTFNPTIPWNTHRVEYKVTNVNTFSNFLITTKDDYITINDLSGYYEKTKTYYFTDRASYDIDELPAFLTDLFSPSGVTVKMREDGCLVLESAKGIEITECSHRVQLLLGIYNIKLPITNAEKETDIVCPSTPMVSYGNLLYLKSHQGNSVGMMINDKNYHTPCIYRINQFLKSGVPLISDKKGDKIIVNAEAAKTITMQLVDFMYEPVILKSPMFITVKIKMIPNEHAFI